MRFVSQFKPERKKQRKTRKKSIRRFGRWLMVGLMARSTKQALAVFIMFFYGVLSRRNRAKPVIYWSKWLNLQEINDERHKLSMEKSKLEFHWINSYGLKPIFSKSQVLNTRTARGHIWSGQRLCRTAPKGSPLWILWWLDRLIEQQQITSIQFWI